MGICAGRFGTNKDGTAPLGRVRPTHLVHGVSTASLIRAKHQNSLPLPTRGADKAKKRANFGATLLAQRHIEAHLRAFSVLKDAVRKFEAI